jgi:hypothetical protein
MRRFVVKSRKKITLFILLAVALSGATQSCSLLFKSEFAELKAADLQSFVETRYPDMYKRQFAQNAQMRKQIITQYKQAFALAQAAEREGLHKTDKFKKQLEIGGEQVLAAKFTEKNPENKKSSNARCGAK